MCKSPDSARASDRACLVTYCARGSAAAVGPGFSSSAACRFAPTAPRRFAPHPFTPLVSMLVVAITLTACNQPPAVNPWRDDAISRDTWTTPSRDGILAAGREPAIRQCDIPEMNAPQVKGEVPHYPLWWEDPLEDKRDQDDSFAWTWQDYVAMPYSFGRFLLNTMAWPVSAIVTPPGIPMASDGEVGRDHDATVGTSPDPTGGPGDFGYGDAESPGQIADSAY